jgi:hypothetical protein
MRVRQIIITSILLFLLQTAHASEFETVHVWDAKVFIGERIVVGESKYGERRIIPITGGSFEGKNIKGTVLPLGEDWQLLRPDGDLELYARYLLKTHDGYLIQVINRALLHPGETDDPENRYVRSVIDLEAPLDSPYDYLNHAKFLGTLTSGEDYIEDGKRYVVIGVHQVL